ncbi:uncharacterized protein LOC122498538 [Leptopilina heterotoma]|uniref:uncharacterized protein LOC122498538 n=1 Tax=Leptopilina heterotoma TaxID=63436 RepID=UPI001CA894FC|nr:uncharacterized protein LOC122498538 [Leptopilina heterotoma]
MQFNQAQQSRFKDREGERNTISALLFHIERNCFTSWYLKKRSIKIKYQLENAYNLKGVMSSNMDFQLFACAEKMSMVDTPAERNYPRIIKTIIFLEANIHRTIRFKIVFVAE